MAKSVSRHLRGVHFFLLFQRFFEGSHKYKDQCLKNKNLRRVVHGKAL